MVMRYPGSIGSKKKVQAHVKKGGGAKRTHAECIRELINIQQNGAETPAPAPAPAPANATNTTCASNKLKKSVYLRKNKTLHHKINKESKGKTNASPLSVALHPKVPKKHKVHKAKNTLKHSDREKYKAKSDDVGLPSHVFVDYVTSLNKVEKQIQSEMLESMMISKIKKKMCDIATTNVAMPEKTSREVKELDVVVNIDFNEVKDALERKANKEKGDAVKEGLKYENMIEVPLELTIKNIGKGENSSMQVDVKPVELKEEDDIYKIEMDRLKRTDESGEKEGKMVGLNVAKRGSHLVSYTADVELMKIDLPKETARDMKKKEDAEREKKRKAGKENVGGKNESKLKEMEGSERLKRFSSMLNIYETKKSMQSFKSVENDLNDQLIDEMVEMAKPRYKIRENLLYLDFGRRMNKSNVSNLPGRDKGQEHAESEEKYIEEEEEDVDMETKQSLFKIEEPPKTLAMDKVKESARKVMRKIMSTSNNPLMATPKPRRTPKGHSRDFHQSVRKARTKTSRMKKSTTSTEEKDVQKTDGGDGRGTESAEVKYPRMCAPGEVSPPPRKFEGEIPSIFGSDEAEVKTKERKSEGKSGREEQRKEEDGCEEMALEDWLCEQRRAKEKGGKKGKCLPEKCVQLLALATQLERNSKSRTEVKASSASVAEEARRLGKAHQWNRQMVLPPVVYVTPQRVIVRQTKDLCKGKEKNRREKKRRQVWCQKPMPSRLPEQSKVLQEREKKLRTRKNARTSTNGKKVRRSPYAHGRCGTATATDTTPKRTFATVRSVESLLKKMCARARARARAARGRIDEKADGKKTEGVPRLDCYTPCQVRTVQRICCPEMKLRPTAVRIQTTRAEQACNENAPQVQISCPDEGRRPSIEERRRLFESLRNRRARAQEDDDCRDEDGKALRSQYWERGERESYLHMRDEMESGRRFHTDKKVSDCIERVDFFHVCAPKK